MLRKFTKSILVAAMLATALSACTSREEAVSKVESEGVVDFQDGWKLYLPGTTDVKMRGIVSEAGPTYVYSEGDNRLFAFSCGDNGNSMAISSGVGNVVFTTQPDGREVVNSNVSGAMFGAGFKASTFNGLVKDPTNEEEAKLIAPANILKINSVDGAEYKLADGLEFTVTSTRDFSNHPAFQTMSKEHHQGQVISFIEKAAGDKPFFVLDVRPFKLPPIQNPGLYSGSVCNFTWDKFDPRDIDSKEVKGALQISEETIKSRTEGYEEVMNKALEVMAQFDKTNTITINGVSSGIWNTAKQDTPHPDLDRVCQEDPTNQTCVKMLEFCQGKEDGNCESFIRNVYKVEYTVEVDGLTEYKEKIGTPQEALAYNRNGRVAFTGGIPNTTVSTPATQPKEDLTTTYTDPNAAKVESDGTVTRSYSGNWSQIYASKSARGDWAPADNSDAAQGRSMYALCHVSGNQNACKRLENRCGKDEYVKTENDMYFCLGADEAEMNQ